MRRGQRLALAGVVGAGALALGGASLLLAPRADEQLSAALGAHDKAGIARIAARTRAGDAGTAILVARSLLAADKADEALTVLTPVAAAHPADAVVADLLERAYAATGRNAERLAAIRTRAERGGAPDVREWRAMALAAGDEPGERAALLRLDTLHAASDAEIERLAWLEERGGAPDVARQRLAARETLSTGALQSLTRLSLATADAPAIAALLVRLEARNAPPTRIAVVDDLTAMARPAVALALIAQAPPGEAAALWPRRIALSRATGDLAAARALVMTAATRPGTATPADMTRAAYAVDLPEALIVAAEHRAIPLPAPPLARDLATRLMARPDLIARLDRVATGDWRAGDPWLAFRVAQASGDRATALRYAAALPGDAADQAREQLLANDRPALRALLLDRAGRKPAPPIAERLLALGFRDDAIAVFRTAATTAAIDAPVTRRLLYLMGPRPAPDSLAWLRRRAAGGDIADRLRWLALYADRDRPAQALKTLEAHPLADRTEILLDRLSLAAAARDTAATTRAGRALLDGRGLSPEQLRAASDALPAKSDPALRLALARRRIAAGIPNAYDRMDLAWSAWNAGDVAAARTAVTAQLAAKPEDRAALLLMADIAAKSGGEKQAQPWLRRALAASADTDSRERAGLLRRLGRPADALAMIRRLRTANTRDRALIADEANLLVATGRPAAAQALFAR